MLGIVLVALALSRPTVAFVPIGGGASTHVSITGTALLQKVTETCRAVAAAAGHEFKPTVGGKIKNNVQDSANIVAHNTQKHTHTHKYTHVFTLISTHMCV